MRLAWAASIIAQTCYTAALWRSGERDLWTWYMGLTALSGVALWPLAGQQYYYAWLAVQCILGPAQLAAAWEIAGRTKDPAWVFTGLWVSLFAASVLFLLGPGVWPLARRVRLLLLQLPTLISAGIVGGSIAGGWHQNYGVIGYICIDLLRAVAEQFAPREALDALNVAYLLSSASFMAGYALVKLIPRGSVPNHG